MVTIRAIVESGSLNVENFTVADNYIADCGNGKRYSISRLEVDTINLVDAYGRTAATLEEPLFKLDRNTFIGQSTDCTYYKFNLVFATKALYQNSIGGKTYPIWFIGDDRIVVGEKQYTVSWSSYGNLQLCDIYNNAILVEEQPFLYDGSGLQFLDVTGKKHLGYPKIAQELIYSDVEKYVRVKAENGDIILLDVGHQFGVMINDGEDLFEGKVASSKENILQLVDDSGRTVVIEKPIRSLGSNEYEAEDVYGNKVHLE